MTGYATMGIVVCDEAGVPIWVGHPDKTDSPKMHVYHDYTKARRALYRIHRATEAACGERMPMRLAQVSIRIERLGEPIVPARRRRADD